MNENELLENKKEIFKDFMTMPAVGKSVAGDLWNLGFRKLDEIKTQDPNDLYERLCIFQGVRIDRCMLYTFKCINYYLNNEKPDPELLKWWNWSDENLKKLKK